MNLTKSSRLSAATTIPTDRFGREWILVVAKGTFNIERDGRFVLSEEQVPVTAADEYYGEPGFSSVRYESDFALRKPRADVVVNGTAYATGGRPAASVDVTLEVSTIRKTIRVYGDRVWKTGALRRYAPSAPIPFVRMPVVYERAFGGTDSDDGGRSAFEMRNLLGVGFNSGLRQKVEGTSLPNLEDPRDLIEGYRDAPRPMGFGFVCRNWQPRTSYAGTYDQIWLDRRFPYLPTDFDERYFQGTLADQNCDFFRGGEVVRLTNLTPEGACEFVLPELVVGFQLVWSGRTRYLKPALDTVIIEPDLRRCLLVWRASTELRGKPTHLREVRVLSGGRGLLRAMERDKRYIQRGMP